MNRAKKAMADAAASQEKAEYYTADKASAPGEEPKEPQRPRPLWPFKTLGRSGTELIWYDNTVDSCARYMLGYDRAVSILKDCEEKLNFGELAERISKNKQSGKPNIRTSYDSYNRNLIDALDDLVFIAGGGRISSSDPSLAFVCQFLSLVGKEDAATRLVLDNSLEIPKDAGYSCWNEPVVLTYLSLSQYGETADKIANTCHKFNGTSVISMAMAKAAQKRIGRSPNYDSSDSIRCAELTGDELSLKGWLVWALAKPYERLPHNPKVMDWPKPVINLIKTKFPFALPNELDADEYDPDSLVTMLSTMMRSTTRVAMHKSLARRLVEVFIHYMDKNTNVTTAEKRTANQMLWLTMFADDPAKYLERILKRTGKSSCTIGMIQNFNSLNEDYHKVIEVLEQYHCNADFRYCYSVY